ncbi:MAG TPA: SDR family oxidoreductase [Vicinamibacterales bacterium]|nr:SDR family oxidoreductase [Vicinamibacterales bacterium]
MKTILVTGTSTGLGFAAAVSLVRAGHDVFATMRTPGKSPELLAQAKRDGLPITIIPLDVDSDESVAAGVKHVLDARGRIDVLVNNAGIAQVGSVEAMPLSTFRRIMETNYFGTVRCIQAVLPAMRAQKSGRIINISSVAGRLAFPGQSAYAASKFAVEALSEALAAEVRPLNIRVNVIEPGVIETPIFGKEEVLAADPYPGGRRMNAIFATALEHPVPASVIGDQVRDIVADESWQLRYPGGPAAAGLMAWRGSLTDEQLIGIGALDDEAWCDFMQANLGLNVRPHLT